MDIEVSLIIPVYNDESSIDIPLESLLRQTETNFEVIIIDDGSKDNTKKVVFEYVNLDDRFKYYYQEHSGVSIARNKGIQTAQGKYISFLDSDDFHESTFIEKMLAKIKAESADLCYCGYNIVTPKGKKRKPTKFSGKNILRNYILDRVSVITSGWVISSEFISFNKLRFPQGVSWAEDSEFFCECLSNTNRVVFVKDYLTNYRKGFAENRLSSFSLAKIDKDFDAIQRILKKNEFSNNPDVTKALLKYRLPALLTYKLSHAFRLKMPYKEISEYYLKYEEHFNGISFCNGLRSIKLKASNLILKIRMIK